MPAVSVVSSTKAPSRIETSRSAVAAIRASWVTTTRSVRPHAALKETQDVERGAAVEIAGGFVGEHDERACCSAPAIGPLALTAGQGRREEAGPIREPDPLEQVPGRRRVARGERPATSASSIVLHRGHPPSRWKAWNTNPTSLRRRRRRAFAELVDAAPAEPHLPVRGGPARRGDEAASTSRSRWAPSPPPTLRRRHRDRRHRPPAPGLPPGRGASAYSIAQHGCAVDVAYDPLPRTVQRCSHTSNQRRSACRRNTTPSNSNTVSRRPARIIAARWASLPAQQLAALRADDRSGSASLAAAATSLEMELGQVGFGPAHLRQPLADPLLPRRGQPVHLAVRPIRQSSARSENTSPARSSRVSVT